MKTVFIYVMVILGLAACSPEKGDRGSDGSTIVGATGTPGTDATACRTEPVNGGVKLICPNSEDVILHGAKGDVGEKGNNGSNGVDGQAGSNGVKGDQGAPGLQGNQGIAGAPGQNGNAGPKGDKGDVGNPGSNGSNGTDGAPGLNGKDGAPGKDAALPTFVTVCHVPNGAQPKKHSIVVPDFVAAQLIAGGFDYIGECL